jgi:hypothetical protein
MTSTFMKINRYICYTLLSPYILYSTRITSAHKHRQRDIDMPQRTAAAHKQMLQDRSKQFGKFNFQVTEVYQDICFLSCWIWSYHSSNYAIFWDVVSCIPLEVHRRFGGHMQNPRAAVTKACFLLLVCWLAHSSILKMVAVCYSETSVILCRITLRYNPEYSTHM